jgi:signal transduction histidine kinase
VAKGELAEGEVRRLASRVVGISDEMLLLLESLLDVALIESGRLELDLDTGNLGELVRDRAERAAVAAADKGIRVAVRTVPVADSGFDRVRMGQVVDNLLSNALKFSEPDSEVEVACVPSGSRVVITVRDHGAGIPAAELRRIFDAYARSTARPTAGERSTGLGLSIAKPIVEAHGGTLDVDSVVGEGTTFTVRMPVDGSGA